MSDTSVTSSPSPGRQGLSFQPAMNWLKAGWHDLWTDPWPSLLYGLAVFAVSWIIVASLFALDLNAYLFPALAGFLVVGPILALGLYDKSRSIERGEPVRPDWKLILRAKSTTQLLLAGVLLCLLFLLWMRAAVILYALFFGLQPFPGVEQLLPILIASPYGWGLLIVGTAVGGLFAAFAFAISVLAVPMLYDQKTDAFTAMALSMSTVWRQLGTMVPWGAVVVALGLVCLASGLVLIILIFPLLGHATWHVYRSTFDPARLV